MIPQYTAYSWKLEKNWPWLIIIPFNIYLEHFCIQKLGFHFLVSLFLHKCWKSLSSKTTLMSLNWKIMDHTMSTIIHVSWIKLLGTHFLFGSVSTRILLEVHSLSGHYTLAKWNWEFLGIPRIFLRIPKNS